MQPRILYPARMAFKTGEIKKKKLSGEIETKTICDH